MGSRAEHNTGWSSDAVFVDALYGYAARSHNRDGGGAAVDCRAASTLVLGDMWGHRFVAQFHDKIAGFVSFVGTERDRLREVGMRFDQLVPPSARHAPEAQVVTAPTIRPLRFSIRCGP
jgi:hypothetical protein